MNYDELNTKKDNIMFYKNLLIFAIILLSGCGFTPMNRINNGQNVTTVTEKIAIGNIPNYDGYLLKKELQNLLNPEKTTGQKDYFLSVTLKSPFYEDQTIQGDNFASRETVTIRASFQLKEMKTNKIILSDSTRATGAYNIVREPYATQMARNKLKDNLIKIISNNISMRIVSFLKSNEEKDEGQTHTN